MLCAVFTVRNYKILMTNLTLQSSVIENPNNHLVHALSVVEAIGSLICSKETTIGSCHEFG